MNNPFDYTPDPACDMAFSELTDRIDTLRESPDRADADFCRELDAGKMLGVLIAVDSDGVRHTLYAFSGQAGRHGFHFPGFVGPVFDYLLPDGYFKTREREISGQNAEIRELEEGQMAEAQARFERLRLERDAAIADFKEKCRRSKQLRDARRNDNDVSADELAAMLRQSQFEKAELRRQKKKFDLMLHPVESELKDLQISLDEMKSRRRRDSENLQQWLFSNFHVLNALGQSKSLSEIFAETPLGVPPSGAGECCAPKLLQAAYLRGWTPEAMAEYWFGKPKEGEVRIHGEHYPACRGKCLPVLGWMLRGLSVEPPLDAGRESMEEHSPKILFENQWFCIVDKPSGMLSVPGKGPEISVEEWLNAKYGANRPVKMAHRLDQDTSGLMVATFGELAFKTMQRLFSSRQVEKTYVADLEGDYKSLGIPSEGRIELPLAPDWLDRPRQRVDFEDGKEAVSDYAFDGVGDGLSRIILRPHTGRTHQLRVHAAAGLRLPIAGDRLYGRKSSARFARLRLHAHLIEFTFPLDGRRYSFRSQVPF